MCTSRADWESLAPSRLAVKGFEVEMPFQVIDPRLFPTSCFCGELRFARNVLFHNHQEHLIRFEVSVLIA